MGKMCEMLLPLKVEDCNVKEIGYGNYLTMKFAIVPVDEICWEQLDKQLRNDYHFFYMGQKNFWNLHEYKRGTLVIQCSQEYPYVRFFAGMDASEFISTSYKNAITVLKKFQHLWS